MGIARTLFALAIVSSTACSPSPATPDTGPITPPFVVSDHFAPTGYEGDGAQVGLVVQTNDTCPTRAPAPAGDCYEIVYKPSTAWAGVVWQYPANNWGTKPGRKILPGAKRLTVWARGKNGGEKLELNVGGVNEGGEFQYKDSIKAGTSVTLTTEWQQFTVNFGPKTYDEVLGAFGWICRVTQEQRNGTIGFYLDGIQWES